MAAGFISAQYLYIWAQTDDDDSLLSPVVRSKHPLNLLG
jgi:hypothetical protein